MSFLNVIDEHPTTRCRWPRFKLSTILVLVAICAWAMSYWPWIHERERMLSAQEFRALEAKLDIQEIHEQLQTISFVATSNYQNGHQVIYWLKPANEMNSQLIWPILTLAAFLAWKLAWTIAARRKRWHELVNLSRREPSEMD